MTDIKMKGNLQNAEIIKLEDDESNQVVKKSSVPHFPSFKRVSLHSINNSILDIRSSINAMGNRNDESSNIWSTIQDKLIPAFSGFGYRGPVEDLNNLVKKWIDRSNPEAIDSDLNIMFKTGMVLIANKLINTSNEMLPQKLAGIIQY
ncbi:hypothetical protein BC833DRAFT_581416 [Globomyces pollinis-pini]|nr:hypothetical protein BC833DRAFT_581416 [Globomyces pollinis-pini]